MPEPIQGVGASGPLTELFGLTGKLPLSLERFVMPVAIVGQLGDDVRWGGLCHGGISLGNPTPNTNQIELSMPVQAATQGLLAHIERINVRVGVASTMYINPSPGLPAPTDAAVVNFADTRKRGVPQLLMLGKGDVAAVTTDGCVNMILQADVNYDWPIEWSLGQNPDTGVNQGIHVQFAAATATVSFNASWREGAAR